MNFSIGIAQIENTPDLTENLSTIEKSIRDLAQRGARLVVFPECALSGYTPKILEYTEVQISKLVSQVRTVAAEEKVSVFLPTLGFDGNNRLNSAVLISEDGGLTRKFSKIGLTPSDQRVFVEAGEHNRIFDIEGTRFAVLFCAEAMEPAWKYVSSLDSFDAILWPGMWGWRKDLNWSSPSGQNGQEIVDNLREWRRPLVQANFSATRGHPYGDEFDGGRSFVLSPACEVLAEGRANEAELLLFNLAIQ